MLRFFGILTQTERLKTAGAKRSPKWSAVRKAHLLTQPACAACGKKTNLEVHHVQPFHLFPQLELVPENLMTLCESPTHNCHLLFGHALLWTLWNPRAREDTATCLAMLGRVRARMAGPIDRL